MNKEKSFSKGIEELRDKIGHFNDVLFCNECRDYYHKDYTHCPDCNFSVSWPSHGIPAEGDVLS